VKAVAALSDESYRAPVEADYSEGVARGIAKTPTALVDGEPFIETIPFEDFSAAIQKALGGK
jgi:protein-disulfide isomerase